MTLVHHPRTARAAGEEPPARAPAADAASGTPPPAAAAPGLEPGTYTWICEVPGHESAGMTGTVVVE